MNDSMWVSINPATGVEIARRQTLDADGIEATLAKAATGFERWRHTTLEARVDVLLQLARLLDTDRRKLAVTMSHEMGKPFRQALGEVKKCAWVCRHYAEHGPPLLNKQPQDSDAERSWIQYDPLGPVLAIMPWNFPLWQVFRFAAPAVLAGNVVVVKHAPNVGACSAAISALWRRTAAPAGLYQELPIAVEAVPSVIADRRIRAITLTGSTRAGRAVAALAGEHLKPVVLELGGSDPFIVTVNADIEAAVATAVTSRVFNNGQSCIAAKRFIVERGVADRFQTGLIAAMQALAVGDPMDEGVDVGPLISAAARDQLHRQVTASVDAGATLALGGRPLAGPGFFYAPTVLTDVPVDAAARREEIFGPVATLIVVEDLDAAIAEANDTEFGLGASIWTRDEREADKAIASLEAGCVFVNGMVRSDPRLPFGGIKNSGFGRELGADGLVAFTNKKTVWCA
ncbi:MAG: succinate-semialdehyde dehydrogenase/glutarate-semialdehyde dehydrogenase [Myxococcota bacterium]|jgi:succinate-semialdehyde dehydrogenase/glutarate-semialdehyde dehydrogenase